MVAEDGADTDSQVSITGHSDGVHRSKSVAGVLCVAVTVRSCCRIVLRIEQEVTDVAILHHVVSPFHRDLPAVRISFSLLNFCSSSGVYTPQRMNRRSNSLWMTTAAACLPAGIAIRRVVLPVLPLSPDPYAVGQKPAATDMYTLRHRRGGEWQLKETRLGPESLALFNGRPARRFYAMIHPALKVVDDVTGEERHVQVLHRSVVVTESYGI